MHLIKNLYAFTCTIMLIAAPHMGMTQVSLDDLEARSSEATTEMDRLREILSSPSTDQAIRAMEIVMSEGSIEQKRIALEASLASTSEAVRRTGIEAYLNAKPLIAFSFDGSSLSGTYLSNFRRYFNRNGTLEANELGRFAYRVGGFLPEKACWPWAVTPENCMFRLTDETVILYLGNQTSGIGAIGKDGTVRGNATIPKSGTVPYSFSVKF